MADPVVTGVTYTRVQAQDGTHFVWDISFVAVTSAGTRHQEHQGYGTPAAGLTMAQVQAAVLAVAVAYDTAEKNPVTPPVNQFAGTFDAVDGSKITLANDPRLPPGVTP